MLYYCKKCGAIVTGRFCSCCGTRATDNFADFRKAERRMNRELKQKGYLDRRFTGRDSFFASDIAAIAFEIAFDRLIPSRALHVDRFDQYSEQCWKKLPECQELAELLYERGVDALLIQK